MSLLSLDREPFPFLRLLMVVGLSPILSRTGYPLHWKDLLVVTWAGLRGAVGLALALVVGQTNGVSPDIGNKLLFQTAGIVLLTLFINATTTGYLLDTVGLSEISNSRRLSMVTAVRRINEAKVKAINMLKSDRFLSDAHWEVVEEMTTIENPFEEDEEIEIVEGIVPASTLTQCPECKVQIPYFPKPKELAELAEDVRLKIIKAEKGSYWRQFEEGLLDREAVLILSNLADSVKDKPRRLIELKDIEHNWKTPKYLTLLHHSMKKLYTYKPTTPPPPKWKVCKRPYQVVIHPISDWIMHCVVIVDIILVILDLTINDRVTGRALRYCYYALVCMYNTEIILKLFGLQWNFFKNPLNIYDVLILIISWVDVILELHYEAIHIIRVLRILRLVRIWKILKLFVLLGIKLVSSRINHHLKLGYSIGKGFVVGEEEVLQQFDRITSVVHWSVAKKMRKRISTSHLAVIHSLGLLHKSCPRVALSVKTHHAIRVVLNHCRDTINQLTEGGVLDETNSEKLSQAIEAKIKRLVRSPVTLQLPRPIDILFARPWLSGLDVSVLNSVQECAELKELVSGDVILHHGEVTDGIYIIVSGFVRVTLYRHRQRESFSTAPSTHRNSEEHGHPLTKPCSRLAHPKWTYFNEDHAGNGAATDQGHHIDPVELHHYMQNAVEPYDFCDVGNVLGEEGILVDGRNKIDAICETDVLVFFISKGKLEALMEEYPLMAEKLWKILGINISFLLLIHLEEYEDWPVHKLLMMLHGSAFVIPSPNNRRPQPLLEIQSDWKQVIAISGFVQCKDTREKLEAPCIVPRKVRCLMMDEGCSKVLVLSSEFHEVQHLSYTGQQPYKTTTWGILFKIREIVWSLLIKLKGMILTLLLRCVNDDNYTTSPESSSVSRLSPSLIPSSAVSSVEKSITPVCLPSTLLTNVSVIAPPGRSPINHPSTSILGSLRAKKAVMSTETLAKKAVMSTETLAVKPSPSKTSERMHTPSSGYSQCAEKDTSINHPSVQWRYYAVPEEALTQSRNESNITSNSVSLVARPVTEKTNYTSSTITSDEYSSSSSHSKNVEPETLFLESFVTETYNPSKVEKPASPGTQNLPKQKKFYV